MFPRHVAFAVEDIDAVVAGLRARGAELVGELERYGDSYRLCYVRGTEGVPFVALRAVDHYLIVGKAILLAPTPASTPWGAAGREGPAFSMTIEIVSGLESGVHTHEFVERGLKATFKLSHGGLLTRDAGSLTYRITFDENDEELDFEVVSIRGPHPAFEEDLFCSTLVPALGLD